MSERKKNLTPVLIPLALGIFLALGFLVYFMSGNNKAVLTVINRTGTTLETVEAGITSLSGTQNLGFLKDGDTVINEFKRFGDGAFVIRMKPVDGEIFSDTLGVLRGREDSRGEIVLEMRSGIPVADFNPAQ